MRSKGVAKKEALAELISAVFVGSMTNGIITVSYIGIVIALLMMIIALSLSRMVLPRVGVSMASGTLAIAIVINAWPNLLFALLFLFLAILNWYSVKSERSFVEAVRGVLRR